MEIKTVSVARKRKCRDISSEILVIFPGPRIPRAGSDLPCRHLQLTGDDANVRRPDLHVWTFLRAYSVEICRDNEKCALKFKKTH